MYHDQALTPFKAINFSHGVNYTAGINLVRTSPDHGTAYDIAGKELPMKNLSVKQFSRQLKFTEGEIIMQRWRGSDAAENTFYQGEILGRKAGGRKIVKSLSWVLKDE